MTRREQIEKKAIEISVNTDRPYVAAIMAIEWADKNPASNPFKAPLHIHDECQTKFEKLEAQLAVAEEALNWYQNNYYDPDAIDPHHSGPNKVFKEALAKIQSMREEK